MGSIRAEGNAAEFIANGKGENNRVANRVNNKKLTCCTVGNIDTSPVRRNGQRPGFLPNANFRYARQTLP